MQEGITRGHAALPVATAACESGPREPVTHRCISARSPLRDLLSKALGHGHVSA